MSTDKAKQDEELDAKIARIRKKNEEILRRRQEIEEDKRLAEKQNAMVKLRPSTDDWPRERTPAMRPSNRELNDFSDGANPGQQVQERVGLSENRGRTHPFSRGREGSGKGSRPPRDPVSFLADPERDYSLVEGEKDQSSTGFTRRGSGRNSQEFRRDGPRRGRGGRGRGGGGSGSGNFHNTSPSANDEAWREERYKIDEARIRRQKSADGKWRREWDNEKIDLEQDEHKASSNVPLGLTNRLDRWKHQPSNFEPSESHEPPSHNFRGRSYGRAMGSRGGQMGRGRGNYKPFPDHSPPPNFDQRPNITPIKPNYSPNHLHRDNHSFSTQQSEMNANQHSPGSYSRLVTNTGDSYKIVVPNTASGGKFNTRSEIREDGQSRLSSRRGRYHEHQGFDKNRRTSSRTSQSSHSEDETPNFGSERSHKSSFKPKMNQSGIKKTIFISENDAKVSGDLKSHKPPLPPFRTSLPQNSISLKLSKEKVENEHDDAEGEESWEDVTTSGTESVGDECSSQTSSPKKRESLNSGKTNTNLNYDPGDIYTPEDFIKLVPYDELTSRKDYPLVKTTISESLPTTSTEETAINETTNDPTDIHQPECFIQLTQSDESDKNSHQINTNKLLESNQVIEESNTNKNTLDNVEQNDKNLSALPEKIDDATSSTERNSDLETLQINISNVDEKN